MSTQVQYRRGTASQNDSFVGALAEITVDTTNWSLRVHDGATAGGWTIVAANSSGNILPSANVTYNLGSTTKSWNTLYTNAVTATGNVTATTINGLTLNSGSGDVAERYLADEDYLVGTVLVIGGAQEVTQSTGYAQTTVVGTVSEQPALIMNQKLEGNYVVDLAFLGRVPCRVVGNINRGDMLVSSNINGVATRMESYVPGAVIGKALESYSSDTPGVIEIIVGRL